MNRILFTSDECRADGTVCLTDHRAEHIRTVLRAQVGDAIKTGTLNGLCGTSEILALDNALATLRPTHTESALVPWFDLILAAPRPKVLKRLWPQLSAWGARKIIILNAFKVEKCYFSSQWLDPAQFTPLLIEGLMQAGTTQLPEVTIAPRFKPFIEDQLDSLCPSRLRLLAHPEERAESPFSADCATEVPVITVGPEGGWTAYELTCLQQRGFHAFSLGARTLRTDTACIALIAVLNYARSQALTMQTSPTKRASETP